jgi:hypothetical protein
MFRFCGKNCDFTFEKENKKESINFFPEDSNKEQVL